MPDPVVVMLPTVVGVPAVSLTNMTCVKLDVLAARNISKELLASNERELLPVLVVEVPISKFPPLSMRRRSVEFVANVIEADELLLVSAYVEPSKVNVPLPAEGVVNLTLLDK